MTKAPGRRLDNDKTRSSSPRFHKTFSILPVRAVTGPTSNAWIGPPSRGIPRQNRSRRACCQRKSPVLRARPGEVLRAGPLHNRGAGERPGIDKTFGSLTSSPGFWNYRHTGVMDERPVNWRWKHFKSGAGDMPVRVCSAPQARISWRAHAPRELPRDGGHDDRRFDRGGLSNALITASICAASPAGMPSASA